MHLRTTAEGAPTNTLRSTLNPALLHLIRLLVRARARERLPPPAPPK